MELSDLWNWKPSISITVNGANLSAILVPRIVSLTIEDTAGIQSDRCEILLADHNPLLPLAIPPTGAEIWIAAGYALGMQKIGMFIVEEVEVSGPPNSMRITGYASAFGSSTGGKSAINEAKTRSWPEGTTVKALVSKIAGESGFEAAVSAEAGKQTLPHLDQIAESDMNLLSRISRDNGLIFKPGGGKLVIVSSGESTAASGEALAPVTLMPKQVTRWRMQALRREAVKKVTATYRDLDGAATVEVEEDNAAAYSDDEILHGVSEKRTIRRTYASAGAAKAAAKAEADRAYRKSRQLTVDCPGSPAFMAEGRLIMAGFRSGVAGEWLINQVTHSFDSSGYRCSLSAELPPKA